MPSLSLTVTPLSRCRMCLTSNVGLDRENWILSTQLYASI